MRENRTCTAVGGGFCAEIALVPQYIILSWRRTGPVPSSTVFLINHRIERWVEDGSGTRLPDSFRRYVYKDALNPIAVLNETGDVLQRFVYGSQGHVPDYMTSPEGTFAFVTDHLGSVRQVINAATGEEVQRLGYDAFGQVLEDTNPGLQPFGFAGGLYDAETSLVRFGARDYDSEVGRWTAKDPIGFAGEDTNLYGYVGQDPVNLLDPSGKVPIIPILLAGTYGLVEMGLTAWDVFNAGRTLFDDCASIGEKFFGVAAVAAGGLLPGGGYGGLMRVNLLPQIRYANEAKILNQMKRRGWNERQIREALATKGIPTRGKKGPATRYEHPESGKSVVVDDTTGEVFHVGGGNTWLYDDY